jgi:hypothetical protein
VSDDVQTAFNNYPVVDYQDYFNIPLSHTTYSSLIPVLKDAVADMKQKKGIDYLMQFTRNAFLYEDDRQSYGKEKRMSPEQTLLNKYSDCDDKPQGETVEYKGNKYTICEPTPQLQDLRVGEISDEFKNMNYQVAYEYIPK